MKIIFKGKAIMWFFTMNVIAMGWYSLLSENKTPIDGSIAACYSVAIASYVGKKGYDEYQATQRQSLTKKMETGDV